MCSRFVISAITSAIFLVVFAISAPAAQPFSSSHSSTGDGPAASCQDLHMRINDRQPELQTEDHTITRAAASTLRVKSEQNGGVQVVGWDNDVFQVTVCKFAGTSTEEAQKIFSQIKVSIQGGDVSVAGPGNHNDWTVFLLVKAPKTAGIEVQAHNGPMGLYELGGKLSAKAVNGPIEVKNCTGEADISAENGPVSVTGNGGNLRLHTQNGPISVELNDAKWNGTSLVADAQNGPVELKVPSGFQTSFLVESTGHGPVSCKASVCGQARKTWDDDEHRKIEFGSGPAVIHLSSVNGPVSVR